MENPVEAAANPGKLDPDLQEFMQKVNTRSEGLANQERPHDLQTFLLQDVAQAKNKALLDLSKQVLQKLGVISARRRRR